MKIRTIIIIGVSIGILLTIASPFFDSVTLNSIEQTGNVRFGFPISFIRQQLSISPFKSDFPITVHISMPRIAITNILLFEFIFSLSINIICMLALLLTIRILFRYFKTIK